MTLLDIYQSLTADELFMYQSEYKVYICNSSNCVIEPFVVVQCPTYAYCSWICSLPRNELNINALFSPERNAIMVYIKPNNTPT